VETCRHQRRAYEQSSIGDLHIANVTRSRSDSLWLLGTAEDQEVNQERGEYVQKDCVEFVHEGVFMHEEADVPGRGEMRKRAFDDLNCTISGLSQLTIWHWRRDSRSRRRG
jgi:hypothetical protein